MRNLLLLLPLLLYSCIGTDIKDDVIVDRQLELIGMDTSLLVGEIVQFNYEYLNQYGIQEEILPIWNNTNQDVIDLSQTGLIRSNSPGQSFIYIAYEGLFSDSVLITVVENSQSIARIEIANPGLNRVMPGETLQLQARAFTIENVEIDTIFNWTLNNFQIASIDSTGFFTALDIGMVNVSASVGPIVSSPLQITISQETQKTAQFTGMNSYNAQGTATLFFNDDNELMLSLGSDFQTEFALGTFIYLANSTSGSEVKGSGLELGNITSNGMHEFNVTALDPNADLESYRYVIVLCKPASITFGAADFN
ncbi:MAG: hypothetical protein RLN79_08315 [Cytophagales bacterium]